MPVPDISRISPFGPKSEYINVIIETPKGSPTKFKYEPEHGLFVFDKTLQSGNRFRSILASCLRLKAVMAIRSMCSF